MSIYTTHLSTHRKQNKAQLTDATTQKTPSKLTRETHFFIKTFGPIRTAHFTPHRYPRTLGAVTGATYPTCCGCRAPSGAARAGRPPSTRTWVATRRRTGVAGSTTNRARSGLWASRPSTGYSIGASTRSCTASAMRGNVYNKSRANDGGIGRFIYKKTSLVYSNGNRRCNTKYWNNHPDSSKKPSL